MEIHPLGGHFCIFMNAWHSGKLKQLDYNAYHKTGSKIMNRGLEKMEGVVPEKKVIVSDILECLELNELE